MKPLISVIIPTFNGKQKVVGILESLEKQNFKDFEVVIVIDGSTDDTEITLKNRVFSIKKISIVSQENKGRSGSRNRGVQEAQADILVFLDDDMRLMPDGLEKHYNFHQQYKNAILVGNQIEDLTKLKTDFQRYKAHLSRKWTQNIENLVPLPRHNFFLTAANFSIPKQLFYLLGKFDEKLTDAEDYDLGKKAMENNTDIYFDDTIIGWHDDFITCRSYIKRQQQYQKAHQLLKTLYPERYQQNQYAYNNIQGIKKFIYHFFAGNLWVDLIDKTKLLQILPKKLRYKIYDLVVMTNAIYYPMKF